jgi:beta-lactamase class A
MTKISNKKKEISRPLGYFSVIVLVVFVGSLLFLVLKSSNREAYIDPAPKISSVKYLDKKFPVKLFNSSFRKFFNSGRLEESVGGLLENFDGEISVVVKNFSTRESYYFNEQEQFAAASLYKLWVMAAAYDQISQGLINENEVLSKSFSELNQTFLLPEDSLGIYSGKGGMTVEEALENMITASDNYSALLLTDRIGFSSFRNYVQKNGFEENTLGGNTNTPTVTASDTAQFFEKLYSGELAEPAYTNKMLNLLKRQQRNSKIPRYLSPDILIAHKTGELEAISHDAGIIFGPSGDYLIVVLTKTENPEAADEVIARISEKVYNLFL